MQVAPIIDWCDSHADIILMCQSSSPVLRQWVERSRCQLNLSAHWSRCRRAHCHQLDEENLGRVQLTEGGVGKLEASGHWKPYLQVWPHRKWCLVVWPHVSILVQNPYKIGEKHIFFSAKPLQNLWNPYKIGEKHRFFSAKPLQNLWITQISWWKTGPHYQAKPPKVWSLSSRAHIEIHHQIHPKPMLISKFEIQIPAACNCVRDKKDSVSLSSCTLLEFEHQSRPRRQCHIRISAVGPGRIWQKPLHPDDKRNSGVGDVGNHQDALLSIPLCQPRGICKPTILQRNSRQQSDCKLSFIRNWSANCRIWTPVGTSRIPQLSYSAGAHRCTCPAGWNLGRVVI